MSNDLRTEFSLREDGVLLIGGRLCVLNDVELKKKILDETHCLAYTMHLGAKNVSYIKGPLMVENH